MLEGGLAPGEHLEVAEAQGVGVCYCITEIDWLVIVHVEALGGVETKAAGAHDDGRNCCEIESSPGGQAACQIEREGHFCRDM
jgi:hypothetical protein